MAIICRVILSCQPISVLAVLAATLPVRPRNGARDWEMVPNFGRITDNGAWTAWFGHILGGSTIMVGKMIRHGDPGDPAPAENSQPSAAHGNYSPKFPIPPGADSADPKLVAR